MRRPWLVSIPLAPLAAVLFGCGGGNTASELVKAPEFNPVGQTKCSVGKSQTKPLIVEWPAADRGALEAQKTKGIVAVRYRGCEMEVLRQCSGPSPYAYTPVTPKQDNIRIRDEDELYATIPVYAAKFEGKLRTAGQLSVDMTIVGSFESGLNGLKRSELEGDCSKATHFISAITTGAFEFAAGGSAEVGAGVEVAGAGAGAKSSAEREVLNRDGYKKACQEATSDDETPPEGCGALLRVEVVALEKEEQPQPSDAGGDAPPIPADDEPVALGPGVVKVHIDSEDPDALIQLIRFGPAVATQVPVQQQGGGTVMTTAMIPSRELICTAPCDSWVDGRKGQQFVVAGDGIPESDPFRLHEKEGDVTLQVDPGSGMGLMGGFTLTYLGIAGAVMAPVFIGLAYGLPETEYEGGEEKEIGPNPIFLYTGVGGAIAGVVGLGIGIPLWIYSGTDYEMARSTASPLVPRVARNGDLQWRF